MVAMPYGPRTGSRMLTWSEVVVIVAALSILATDTSHLPWFPLALWAWPYAFAAGTLTAWKATGFPALIAVTGAVLFVTSFARAVSFAIATDRYAGAAINTIMCVFWLRMVRSQTIIEDDD